MQNSGMVFTFSVLYQKYPFLANLIQKIKIVGLKEFKNKYRLIKISLYLLIIEQFGRFTQNERG